jgi:microcystin synthetase protein McyJ
MILRGQLRGKVGRRREYFERAFEKSEALSLFGRLQCPPVSIVSGLSRAAQILGVMVRRFPRHAGTILRQTIKSDPADYYTFVGTDLVSFRGSDLDDSRAHWLNIGDWRTARTYDAACAALADRLADAAHLEATDEVLDAGFGFGDQDFHWLAAGRVQRIVGINITPLHVGVARRRAQSRGLAARAQFLLASATELPAKNASFDKVISLEAACHFRTRDQFFAEALRVLKPGGWMGLTDVIPLPGDPRNGLMAKIERRFNAFPEENLYDRHEYARRLQSSGFVDVTVTSIRNDVFPGMAKFIAAKKRGEDASAIVVALTPDEIERCAGDEIWTRQGIGDYVLVSARKPA